MRHGESEGNAGLHYQNENTVLSAVGQSQADAVADRASRLSCTALLASSMVRAQETARAISSVTGLTVETSDLLIERRRPSEQIDQLKNGPASVAAEEAIILNSGIPGYRYSDEENFDELMERAEKAFLYIAEHSSDKILVVTHGVFLRVLIAFSIFGREITEREYKGILDSFTASNTGITVLKYNSENQKPWSLLTWNDHSHLG